MNQSTKMLIQNELKSLYNNVDESHFRLNNRHLLKGNRFNVTKHILDFSTWIDKRYAIEDVADYHVAHYKKYLERYKNYDSFIKMKIENDLQILQIALIRYFQRNGEKPSLFVPKSNVFRTVYCPYCRQPATLKSDQAIYKRSFGMNIYICDGCQSQVGTHGQTIIPKGTLAKKDLRKMRMTCHQAVHEYRERKKSYRKMLNKLQDVLEVDENHAQISALNERQCRLVLKHFN